jgi:hypothetical protein
MGDRLAERSIALVSQASEMASNYAELAGVVLGRGESDSALPSPAVIQIQNEVQTRLACVQRTLVRRQAEMVRLQAMKLRVASHTTRSSHDRLVRPGHGYRSPRDSGNTRRHLLARRDCPAEQGSAIFVAG